MTHGALRYLAEEEELPAPGLTLDQIASRWLADKLGSEGEAFGAGSVGGIIE